MRTCTLYRNGSPYLLLQGETDVPGLLARMRALYPAVRWTVR